MHHKDLAGIRAVGCAASVNFKLLDLVNYASFFLVGGIVCGEDALSSRGATMGSLPIESRDENGTPFFVTCPS
jgi:hypothetical protein